MEHEITSVIQRTNSCLRIETNPRKHDRRGAARPRKHERGSSSSRSTSPITIFRRTSIAAGPPNFGNSSPSTCSRPSRRAWMTRIPSRCSPVRSIALGERPHRCSAVAQWSPAQSGFPSRDVECPDSFVWVPERAGERLPAKAIRINTPHRLGPLHAATGKRDDASGSDVTQEHHDHSRGRSFPGASS